jgi:putative cardiolipin synthase
VSRQSSSVEPAGLIGAARRGCKAVLSLGWVVAILAGCATLPQPGEFERVPSAAFTDTQDTSFGRDAVIYATRHPGQSGFYPLTEGLDALVARIALANEAERSLDVQYYIWHADFTGRFLLERLLAAADRGVRVRLLLDDIHTAGKDEKLAALDWHSNIEIRLFNPFAMRKTRSLEFVTDLGRVNRRMHNKSFTADNQITIIGGRNIGDEYFEARPDLNFGDLDVVAVGRVVSEVSRSFDEYWNSEWAFPIAAFGFEGKVDEDDLSAVRETLHQAGEELRNSPYAKALEQTQLVRDIDAGELPFDWGQAWLIYDRPEKMVVESTDETTSVGRRLERVVAQTDHELLVVSPYMVPGKEGVEFFRELVERGVRVRVLTNSLAATDVAAVHSGYGRYRIPMLRAGVELYELKPDADWLSGAGKSSRQRASLHAKSFAFDRRYLFVGSFNLDPRSDALNTEMGVLFESKDMVRELGAWFEQEIERDAYRVELVTVPASEGEFAVTEYELEWVTVDAQGTELRYDIEPETSFWRRLGVSLLSILPIESQL